MRLSCHEGAYCGNKFRVSPLRLPELLAAYMLSGPTAIFVYGTLKRGGVREICWPRKPLAIEAATVHGALYDLGPYPALVEGHDVIAGELWHFAAEDLPSTLAVLDEVEGYSGNADDWYRRVIIECQATKGAVQAWTYLYARTSELRDSQRIKPDASGVCHWPA
jgi:gamma-glutamylcyclotransferase (GGCT)/AIG2-like uncharacterized protein YtfP